MRYATTPVTETQVKERMANAAFEWDYLGLDDDESPFEWKVSDWGVLRGHLVAVDYAINCLDEKTVQAINTWGTQP